MTNGLVQHITVEESTSIQWVKGFFPLFCFMFVFFIIQTPKRIKVGDRTVILRQDNRRGILDIYEQKNLPDGSAGIGQLDRVIYHD